MSDTVVRRFDIGQTILDVNIEDAGARWLSYWLIGGTETRFYLTDGTDYVEVANPHEWQDVHADALALTGDLSEAADLTGERIKYCLQQRGQWEFL